MVECFAQTGFRPARDAAALFVSIEALSPAHQLLSF